MALSEKSRHKLYEFLCTTPIGEEATSEMLSYFPARDVEEPITKSDLQNEVSLIRLELHTEIDTLRDDLRTEMAALRDDLRTEMATLRNELLAESRDQIGRLDGKIDELRAESRDQIGRLDGKIDVLRAEMHGQLYWMIGTMIGLFGILAALVVATG